MPISYFDNTPSLDDAPGVNFEMDPYGTHPVTKEAKLKESAKLPPLDEIYFDDTFQDTPKVREARLKEAGFQQSVKPQPGMPNQQLGKKPSPFAPKPNAPAPPATDPDVDSKIIDGEHQTLLSIGKMPEPQPEDNHQLHNTQHRAMLADPKLKDPMHRATLLNHIGAQSKLGGLKTKSTKPQGGPQQTLSREARINQFANAKKVVSARG